MSDSGWPGVTGTVEGGIQYPTPPRAQEKAFNTALWTCEAKYSIDPRLAAEATPEMLEVEWHYLKEYAIPCLKAHGVEPPGELPSKNAFVASEGAFWPYPPAPPPLPDEIKKACPATANSKALLGIDP